jgi:Glycosyltransferase family 87
MTTDLFALPDGWRPSLVVRILALAACLLFLATFLYRGPLHALRDSDVGRDSVDFAPIYGGARAWFHGGNPYDIPTIHSEFYKAGGLEIHHPNNYFPPMLAIASIASWSNWATAKFIWMIVEVLAWGATLYGVMKMADWKPPVKLILVIWGLGCWPAVMSIRWGQPAMLCCALTVWAIWLAHNERNLAAGILLGLAACTKPTLAAAAVFFCLLQLKFRPLFIAGLTAAVLYLGVLAPTWPASSHWLALQQKNTLEDFTSGPENPLPSGPEVTDLVNIQPVIAVFSSNLTAGNILTFLFIGILFVLFFLKLRRTSATGPPGTGNWPGVVAFSVATALVVIYHRYADLFLIVAIFPACYQLYKQGRYRLLAAVVAILAILSVPTQTELAQRLAMNPDLRSHEPLEYVRVLILFRHQAFLLIALAFLSFRMLVGDPAADPRRNFEPAAEAAAG